MCACKFKTGNKDFLVQQGFSNIIPASSFASGQTYEDFRFFMCINRNKVLKALSTIKLDDNTTLDTKIVTDEDLRTLVGYVDNKEDVQKWGVDIKKLIGSITFDQSEIDTAQCDVVAFSND